MRRRVKRTLAMLALALGTVVLAPQGASAICVPAGADGVHVKVCVAEGGTVGCVAATVLSIGHAQCL